MKFLLKLVLYGFFICLGALTNNLDPEEDYNYDDYEDDDFFSNSTINGTFQFVKELSNLTKNSGETLKLRCDVKILDLNVSLAKTRATWSRNEAPLSADNNDKRIFIKTFRNKETRIISSRLRILNLELLDTGFYACVISNGKTKIRSTNFCKVNSDRWVHSNSEIPKYEPVFPETPSLSDITTLLPHFSNVPFDQKQPDNTFIPNLEPQNLLPTLETTNGSKFDAHHATMQANFSVTEPFCQIYTGQTCAEFLQHKYVFVQPPFTQKNIEEKLTSAFLVISHSNDLSDSCRQFAQPSLCYSAFPLCIDDQLVNMDSQPRFVAETKRTAPENIEKMYRTVRNHLALRRICRSDCEILENELCRVEYAIAKRHPVIGQTLQLEECVTLPEPGAPHSEYCLPLGIDSTQGLQPDEACYWGNGETYRGVQDFSGNGTKCLKWAHQYQIQLANHPELAGHSFCRNPDGVEGEPFCYVEQTRRELCQVPKCATYLWIYISIAFVLITTVVATVMAYLFCYKDRNKRDPRSLQNMNIPAADKNIYGNSRMNSPMELNPMLPQQANNIPPMRNQHSNKNSFQNVPNYSYKEVSFIEELGEGAFGKVYKGELKAKTGKIFVAVKALKENASAKTQADFQREIDLISELRHPNIICLLGIIVKQEPMCMLFEFMSEGDLHEFLRANSPSENKSLTQNEFLHIALQIALGMEYLSSNHYVHRDLAARNCLVSKDLIVKISDFGLSRDMYSCDYYRVQSKSLLPVRWMPPESILYGKFTTESDVWSYGVVLWEIYSYGLQPYYGYNNQEVINMIRSRKLLPCPEYCPSYCYSLMVECWAELAIRRPSFGEICHRLRVWKQNGIQINTGAYFKEKNSQKFGHCSKSPASNFDQEIEPSLTWDRKSSSHNLNASQSSLTSRTSSLGNKTQSTSISNSDQNSLKSKRTFEKKSHRSRHSSKETSLDRLSEVPRDLKARHTIVNSNGENFETTLSY